MAASAAEGTWGREGFGRDGQQTGKKESVGRLEMKKHILLAVLMVGMTLAFSACGGNTDAAHDGVGESAENQADRQAEFQAAESEKTEVSEKMDVSKAETEESEPEKRDRRSRKQKMNQKFKQKQESRRK